MMLWKFLLSINNNNFNFNFNFNVNVNVNININVNVVIVIVIVIITLITYLTAWFWPNQRAFVLIPLVTTQPNTYFFHQTWL